MLHLKSLWSSGNDLSWTRSVLFWAICFLSFSHLLADTFIQSVSRTIYAENFTYYHLSIEGWLRLELHSIEGDVDLYVSSSTLQPSFLEYELKSETCGVDIVEVSSVMKRPVGIGIYAHPFYPQSTFKLEIVFIAQHEPDDYAQLVNRYHFYEDYDYNEEDGTESFREKNRYSSPADTSDDEEEPVWWTLMIGLLKFVFEVIV